MKDLVSRRSFLQGALAVAAGALAACVAVVVASFP